MIIDCHGHYTTAPPAHTVLAGGAAGGFEADEPPPPYPTISDDEIRESVEGSQLRLMAERGIDLTVFSPRASAMGHHFGRRGGQLAWAEVSNDLIARVVELYPDHVHRRRPAPAVARCARSRHSVAELRRCVGNSDSSGCNLNPDPSGGHWTSAAADRPQLVPALRGAWSSSTCRPWCTSPR